MKRSGSANQGTGTAHGNGQDTIAGESSARSVHPDVVPLNDGVSRANAMPLAFPEITLRAPGVMPPMVLLALAEILIPVPLPRSADPVRSVPMKLPLHRFPVPPKRATPVVLFEIRLRAAGVVPPMMLLDDPKWPECHISSERIQWSRLHSCR